MDLLQHEEGKRKSGSVFGSRSSIWLDAEEQHKSAASKSKDKRRQARSYWSVPGGPRYWHHLNGCNAPSRADLHAHMHVS